MYSFSELFYSNFKLDRYMPFFITDKSHDDNLLNLNLVYVLFIELFSIWTDIEPTDWTSERFR